MNELPYPSDLTAAQWALIEPLLPAAKPRGRKRKVELRSITNAILYVLKGGITWRMLPRDFAPWKTCTTIFALGGSLDCGVASTINCGSRYESTEGGMLVRVVPLWTARAWPPSKRGRSRL